ncbi:hypothetical protein T01_8331 [Trichinella spiralis]|uniref:Uncharacterized protein n=1 Tax=Trichinella spiralis TaxID=6334 RepID=A0A0V1BAA9_TRISP|nr:hypothetical protein T01_8331 [Trichinella spiralis]
MRMDCCGDMFQGSEIDLSNFDRSTVGHFSNANVSRLLLKGHCAIARCCPNQKHLSGKFSAISWESGDQVYFSCSIASEVEWRNELHTGQLELFSNQTCPTALCLSFICDKMAEQLRRDPFAHRDQFRIAVVQSAAGLENTTCEYRDERWGKMKSQASRVTQRQLSMTAINEAENMRIGFR